MNTVLYTAAKTSLHFLNKMIKPPEYKEKRRRNKGTERKENNTQIKTVEEGVFLAKNNIFETILLRNPLSPFQENLQSSVMNSTLFMNIREDNVFAWKE